jgi:hypothetical protein
MYEPLGKDKSWRSIKFRAEKSKNGEKTDLLNLNFLKDFCVNRNVWQASLQPQIEKLRRIGFRTFFRVGLIGFRPRRENIQLIQF